MREAARNGLQTVIDAIPENENLYIALDVAVIFVFEEYVLSRFSLRVVI